MDHVRMQALFGPQDAHDTLNLAVLYDVYACSAALQPYAVLVV